MTSYTSTHWGIYEHDEQNGKIVGLKAFRNDPDPSPIGLSMFDACTGPVRIKNPVIRESVFKHGIGANPERRGCEPFVEVSWDAALDACADALRQAIAARGNAGIFGGSYGWSSAGRFHHAQSQIHRFLNAIGGYVRHTDSYSLGVALVILPHIIASMRELMVRHTSWNVLEAHTDLYVSFGGAPRKNAQVSPGGVGEHLLQGALNRMRCADVRFVNISPVGDDIDTGGELEWIPIRPNTDTALMLALAYVLYDEDLHDKAFLDKYCVGFERFSRYLIGADDGQPKTPKWAEAITKVPASQIAALARDMAKGRTMVTASWSIQRAHHGEQPYWMLVTLAAMLGQIGLPGGGFGVGYGALNSIGSAEAWLAGPTFSQGTNKVEAFIPVARITDMLERPGAQFNYNGGVHRYPHIDLIYWAGGNPFHHHQDLNRLMRAWRRPASVIIHEQFWNATAKMADIVLPVTTSLERDDISQSYRERYLVAMKQAVAPVGAARDDYEIFAGLAERFGVLEQFTEGRTAQQWLRQLYEESRQGTEKAGIALPAFDEFWEQGLVDLSLPDQQVIMFDKFRADPVTNPLKTPSGKIEIFSERIAGFGYADCDGHPRWYEPIEWLGSTKAQQFPLHLLSDQPHTKLHSQFDHGALSIANKIQGREPVTMHRDDAAERGINDGDVVRVWNERGACLAGARLTEQIRRGVVKISTGAWYDPVSYGERDSLDKHGNPNVLAIDIGSSELSQGCAAQTCLVQIERFEGALPAITAFDLPEIVPGR